MDKKQRRSLIIGLFLVIAVGNYSRMEGNDSIRTVQFLNIWAIGALSGLLIWDLARRLRGEKTEE